MDLRDQLQQFLGNATTIERELGGGGMSRVFVADERMLGRKVVVKVLSPDLTADVSVERFRREIQVAARLQHPHIVPLLSASEDDGLLYYSMPFVEGESLRDRLARDGELPIGDVVRIVREVADALSYAHERGVVHRDIKPENILLSGGHAVVADFGIAKALAAATPNQKLTSTGLVLGTPAYMSPEQAVGDSQVDHRADLYAVGSLAYEMLAGQPPFAGRSAQAVIAAHVTEVPEHIAKRRPSISPAFAQLVMRLLEKRAADRPQSANELIRALDALTTTPVAEHPPAAQRAPVFVSRGRRRTALIAAAAFIGIAALVGSLALRRRDGRSTESVGQRVAVAPFQNLTGDPSLDHVGRIAAELLGQAIVRAESVDVVSPEAVALALKTSEGTSDVIARLATVTGAKLIVRGIVARHGRDSLEFRATVVDARTGKVQSPIGPETGPVDDPNAAIDELSGRLLSALVSGNVMANTIRAAPPKWKALQEFDAGQQLVTSRGDWEGARPYYERAVALDSTFGLAYNLLALSYLNTGAFDKGDTILQRLDRLRFQLPVIGRLQLDGLHTILTGNLEARLRAVQAMAAQDSSPVSLFLLGATANSLLRPRIAVPALERFDSLRATAGDLTQSRGIGTAYHQAGSHDAELRVALRARRQFPVPAFVFYQLRAYAGLHKSAEAVALVDTTLRSIVDSAGMVVPFLVDGALELRAHGDSVTAARMLEMTRAWYATHRIAKPPRSRLIDEGRILYLSGRLDSAESRFTRAARDNSGFDVAGYLALIALRRGNRTRAAAVADSLGALRRKWMFGANTEWRAAIVGALGEKERAVQLLRQANQEGASMENWHSAPQLIALHGYPPFDALILPQK